MTQIEYGALELLIIQASPFCNIDCKYCYLPDRLNQKRISLETIEAVFTNLFKSDIVRKDFTVCWHAGEPLTVSRNFYEKAIDIANKSNNTNHKIRYNVQTNATLINDSWCELFKEKGISVSVSIDGPEFIHNKNRVTRNGEGTFEKVIKGIDTLRKHKIEFNVISVLSDYSLDFVDEYYNFFKTLQPQSLGINIEEIENANKDSSLFDNAKNSSRFSLFMKRLMELYYDNEYTFGIREFGQLEHFILTEDKFLDGFGQQTLPYKIISVDVEGNYSTFSPELLNAASKTYGSFTIGNVHRDNFIEALSTDKFNQIYSDILKGIIMCKESCKYFSVCGGGTPSNKYSENGTFVSTETDYCKYKFQTIFDTFIDKVESSVIEQQPA